jgi:regulator of cell morphogenesis and NO signaling
MQDPIDQLLAEHREIMAEVETLRRAVADLHVRGEAALPAAVPSLASVGRMMATRLLRHARKEDEALFPAIEQAIGAGFGPTRVMREEHRSIHERSRLFRETLRELNEVEHPAIEAGGERLRALTGGGGGDAATLAATGATIVELLDLHFGKEEDILFPMAREVLPRDVLRAVADRMAAIEAEAA